MGDTFTCTISGKSVTIVTRLTTLTTEASGIKQASQAPAGDSVTVTHVRRVGVVITRTRLAATAWDERVAIVTVSAFLTLFPSVAFLETKKKKKGRRRLQVQTRMLLAYQRNNSNKIRNTDKAFFKEKRRYEKKNQHKTKAIQLTISNQRQYLGNCAPTPPLTKQVIISLLVSVNVGLGEG